MVRTVSRGHGMDKSGRTPGYFVLATTSAWWRRRRRASGHSGIRSMQDLAGHTLALSADEVRAIESLAG